MIAKFLIIVLVLLGLSLPVLALEGWRLGAGLSNSGGKRASVTFKYWITEDKAVDFNGRFGYDSLFSAGYLSHHFLTVKIPRLGHWDRHWGTGIFVHNNKNGDSDADDHGIYVKYGFGYMFEIFPCELFADVGPGWGLKQEEFRWVGGIGARCYFGTKATY